jgi:uncharacterized membrane protein (UPF0127 family)
MDRLVSLRTLILLIAVLAISVVAVAYTAGAFENESRDPYPEQESVILDGEPAGQVTFYREDEGQIQTVDVWIAETRSEQYQGLSDTQADDLPLGTGLLFTFDAEAERNFVMRGMNYPLDIVFIASNGTVTAVYEADLEDPDKSDRELTWYGAQAQYVLEVRQGTTNDSVRVGTRTEILSSPDG